MHVAPSDVVNFSILLINPADNRWDFFQGMFYFILLGAVLVSLIAFSVTKHHIYLYMGLASVLLVAIYTGYFRRRIRKQFNIRVSISWDICFLIYKYILFIKFAVFYKSQVVAHLHLLTSLTSLDSIEIATSFCKS